MAAANAPEYRPVQVLRSTVFVQHLSLLHDPVKVRMRAYSRLVPKGLAYTWWRRAAVAPRSKVRFYVGEQTRMKRAMRNKTRC